MLGSSRGCTPGQIYSRQLDVENKNEVIVNLLYDGGKENPVDLNRQDEGEVEEQSGGIPQKHLQVFGLTDGHGRGVNTVQCSLI